MTILERIKTAWQRLAGWARNLWPRLLNANVPIARGYLGVCLLAILLFALGYSALNTEEQRLISAIRQDPTNSKPFDKLQQFHWDLGWLTHDKIVLQRLAAELPSNPWPWVDLARLDYVLTPGQAALSPEGLNAAERAVQLAAGDDRALLDLAALLSAADEPERAAQAAQKAVSIVPDSSEAHFRAGQALKQAGHLDAAEREFRAGASVGTGTDEEYSHLSYAELLTATRALTITLHADHLMVQTSAELDTASPENVAFLMHGNPPSMAQQLAWGQTEISPGSHTSGYHALRFERPTTVEGSIVSNQGQRIDYDDMWEYAYRVNDYPRLTISDLPLSAYSMPTTITVVAEGAEIISTTHPYKLIEGNMLSWQVAEAGDPGRDLGIAIRPNPFNRLKLALASSLVMIRLAYFILWALPTVWGILLFFRIRRSAQDVTSVGQASDTNIVYRAFRPNSPLSWLFDLALLASGLFTILYPPWLSLFQNFNYGHFVSYYAFIIMLGLLLAWLALSNGHQSYQSQLNLVHLGALVFVCYLIPRLFYSVLGPVYLVVSAVAYYLLLTRNRNWLTKLNWQQLAGLFSDQRKHLVERIVSLDRLPRLENAAFVQDLALAKGQMQASEYEASRKILDQVIQQRKGELSQLRDELGIPDNESPKTILFRLGPAATPFKNSLIALGFGMIPFILFMVVASYREEISLSNPRTLLSTTVGLPWGPIYLFFFGYFFRVLWGDYGVMKGLAFGGVLAALNALFQWMWLWNQMDGVELWGTTIRILITFVFTGAMMDWTTLQFSWGRIQVFYDSPVFTTIITVIGTAVTTVIAGLATGTMDRLLSVAVQGAAAAFGAPTPPSP
jgi:tetratricopeptide (TPR) repeat protein